MIAVINYGLGNTSAFLNVYKRLNIPACLATEAEDLRAASKLILPGVGAFDHAMELLDGSGMRQTLDELVLEKKTPILGVCVGMQILSGSSDEGRLPGLGWIPGEVKSLESRNSADKPPLPHMGWNDVRPLSANRLFEQLESGARFYFLHSYCFHCSRDEDVVAVSDYGGQFPCAVNVRNIYGVQFHPEKSHHFGSQLLKNFAQL